MPARLIYSPRRSGPRRAPSRDLEHTEQARFVAGIQHLAMVDRRYALPVSRTYAVPNGGARTAKQAGRLKAEGVRAGVSDIAVALPAGRYHGLYIEMKSAEGRPTAAQREWITESLRLGYYARVCYGHREAFEIWKTYVDGGNLP